MFLLLHIIGGKELWLVKPLLLSPGLQVLSHGGGSIFFHLAPICRSAHQNPHPSERVKNNHCFTFWHFQWTSQTNHPSFPSINSHHYNTTTHQQQQTISVKKKKRKHGSSEMLWFGSNLGCLLASCHGCRSRSSELWLQRCSWGHIFPLNAPQVSGSCCFLFGSQRDGLSFSDLSFCSATLNFLLFLL